jgi:hypothetical protein
MKWTLQVMDIYKKFIWIHALLIVNVKLMIINLYIKRNYGKMKTYYDIYLFTHLYPWMDIMSLKRRCLAMNLILLSLSSYYQILVSNWNHPNRWGKMVQFDKGGFRKSFSPLAFKIWNQKINKEGWNAMNAIFQIFDDELQYLGQRGQIMGNWSLVI